MYYVHLNNATYGPYTEQQVRQMVSIGQVYGSTLVFEQGGQQQWVPASQFPNLFKNPVGIGMPAPNPVATSIPIVAGNVESVVWQGRPSVWTLMDRFFGHLFFFVVLTIVGAFLWEQVPAEFTAIAFDVIAGIVGLFILWLLWQWILIKTGSWTLTTERLCWEKGVFSKTTQNLELYRIKDVVLRKPFLMRMLKHGYVDFVTSDQSEKRDHLSLGAIPKPEDLHAMLRKYVERQRQQKGVREVDFWHA